MSKEQIKYITNPDDLIVGRSYWLVEKDPSRAKKFIVSELMIHLTSNITYFENYIWVPHFSESFRSQALSRWEIYGPVPLPKEPDFESLKNSDEIMSNVIKPGSEQVTHISQPEYRLVTRKGVLGLQRLVTIKRTDGTDYSNTIVESKWEDVPIIELG